MKKILFAYNFISEDNEYVKRLYQITSLVENVELYSGLEEFWNPSREYDFIIINWPDYLFDWKRNLTDEDIKKIDSILDHYKSLKTKIINIRHDTYPHADKSKNAVKLYDLVNIKSDVIVHLGENSLSDYKIKHPNTVDQKHYVMPHVLFNDFNLNLDREKLREKYNLKKEDFYVFVPGNMRNYSEFKTGISLYKRINKKNKHLHFQKVQKSFFPIKKLSKRYIVHILKKKFLYNPNKISFGFTYLTTEKISELFTISDLIIIPRINNLNSGNITLSAQFGKPFLAIESGNITEWTKQLNQILIPMKDLQSDQSIEIPNSSIGLQAEIVNLSNDNIILDIMKNMIHNA